LINSLDNIINRSGSRPDVIKMDVQGFEYFVAQGMQQTLDGDRLATVITEFWPHGITQSGASPREFVEIFESRGFRSYHLSEIGNLERIPSGMSNESTHDKIIEILSMKRNERCIDEDLWMTLVFRR
jgi:hypothetical protein